MDVFKQFPLMIPVNLNRNHYKGFIQVQSECFHLELQKPLESDLSESFLRCECKVCDVLRGYEDLLKKRFEQCSSVSDFLQELTRLLELQLNKTHCAPRAAISSPSKFYSKLIEEIEEVGWDKLVFIDSHFSELHLAAVDAGSRQHILKVTLHPEYPRHAPRCMADLPEAFDVVWTTESTLSGILGQFSRRLDRYQDFWDALDEIDSKTWVLEPEKPTRADTRRRIALGNNASVQITVLAQYPRMLPECRFMGAEPVVAPLKARLNENLHIWGTSTSSLLESLQKLLGIEFPSPAETKKEDFSMECAFCYCYRLGDEVPDQACDDPRCGLLFHSSCLYEWFRSLPSFRQSFNIAFGECSFCGTALTVKMPT